MRYDLVVIGDDTGGIDAAMEAAVCGDRVAVVARLSPSVLERLDLFAIDVVAGDARFVAEDAIVVNRTADDVQIESCRFVLAVGVRPWRPTYVPFDGERIVTADEQPSPTGETIVVGSGTFGLRQAIRLAERNVRVTVVDGPESGLLLEEDETVAELLQLAEELGVTLHLGSEAIGFDRQGDRVTVELLNGIRLVAETVVFAAGVEGNTESLDLPRIGLETDERSRLWCDAAGRTSVGHVSAVGAVVGHRTREERPVADETPLRGLRSRRTRPVAFA